MFWPRDPLTSNLVPPSCCSACGSEEPVELETAEGHDSQELENLTWMGTEVERRAEGHYPHLGAPFTSLSSARMLKELNGHLLVSGW